MTEDNHAPITANRMLGSQLVNKSIIRSQPSASSGNKQAPSPSKNQQQQQQRPTTATESYNNNNENKPSPARVAATSQPSSQNQQQQPRTPPSKAQDHQTPTQIPKSKRSPELKQAALVGNTEDRSSQTGQQQVVGAVTPVAAGSSAKELQLLAKEAQDLKAKTRKLQLEIDEKNEIINVLRDELETLREQNDKYHRDSIQLIKDSKRVKFLQDENDFLQDRVGQVEILELEIKKLKERLNETEFFKLRVSELEEDLNKSREESNQFEDNWRQAESKLTRVAELETELNKWKCFSHELELEKNSIQTKLLESIDHETKLDSDNKKVEDEVRRLRDLIKSYEEQRDEEQASNSLIMSVADLKHLDSQHQQQQVANHVHLVEAETNTEPRVVQVEIGQQTDISDTAEKSCETEHVDIVELDLKEDNKHLATLNIENETLKEELKRQENRLDELANSNKLIIDELDGNKRLISDLRQDLACEKSLTQKLTTQLTSFTKQIKSLDKQYFPMHDTTATKAAATTIAQQKQQIDLEKRPANQSKLAEDVDWKHKSTPTATVTPTRTKDEPSNSLVGANSADVPRKISSPVEHVNGLKEELKSLPSTVDKSHQQHQANKKDATVKSSANSTSNNDTQIDCVSRESESSRTDVNDVEDKDTISHSEKLTRAPTPHKSSYRPERDTKSSNFVRNSLPSKSVNFGHSKSSPYLDRIRASVTATATTSTSNTSTACFNEQTTKNVVIPPISGLHVSSNIQHPSGFVLNCMLNHNHSERCFAKVERPAQVEVSQPTPPNVLHSHPNHVNQSLGSHNNHPANHYQSAHASTGVSPSRQLNALIDPVGNEQLLMGMLQQQIVAQQQSGLPSAQQLTEQQIAHLNNLQRQHYYHHLHQLHQIHHLHQLHHLHHKCQQQQQQHASRQPTQQPKPEPNIVAPDFHANMVGSQFYAPSYDQVYANMASNNNTNNQLAEHRNQRQNGTRLVNHDSDMGTNVARQHQQQYEYKRVSPQRAAPANPVYHHQMVGGTKLAQIDELTNGLQTGLSLNGNHVKITNNQTNKQAAAPIHRSSPKARAVHQSNHAQSGAGGGSSSQQRQQQSSPILSSPSSSRTSSNISPSSEASSSSSTSSTNSLSTSVPLTRSALRHTSTDLTRRQYSVERELINSTPLTATLSRVGSCRGAPTSHHNHHLDSQRQLTTPKDMNSIARDPVRLQQTPMRTSKILSIGSQQRANTGSTTTTSAIDTDNLTLCQDIKKTPNVVGNFNRPVANNLANIKLNDNQAFSSLRMPKKSSSGSNLNASLIEAATNGRSINSRVSSASTSPDKIRLLKAANTSLTSTKSSNIGAANNNNGHSSVWYEYGCI